MRMTRSLRCERKKSVSDHKEDAFNWTLVLPDVSAAPPLPRPALWHVNTCFIARYSHWTGTTGSPRYRPKHPHPAPHAAFTCIF